MSNIQIPNLPAVTALSGAELFEGVQSGSSVKISLAQVLAAAATGTSTALPFQVSVGGTGADNASDARTNLGLGTIAVQDANSVVITGGSINGTSIGGTTASTGSFTTGTFGAGSAAAPSITFTGDTDTGIWSPGVNQVSISTTGVERFAINGAGNAFLLAVSTEDRSLQIGEGRTGNGNSLIDLVGDATYTDFGTRLARNLGANGNTALQHRGTGSLALIAQDAGSVVLQTNSISRVVIPAIGGLNVNGDAAITTALNVGINRSADGLSQIALVADTASQQSLTLNAYAGTNGIRELRARGTGGFQMVTQDVSPITFNTNSAERFRIGASGQWGIAGANYGTSGQAIVSAGAAAAPEWGAVGLNGGGTGVTTAPAAAAVLYGYTSTATAAGTTVLTNTSSQYQLFTGVTTQIITLPVTSTLTTGWTFHIVNASTGNLTVNSSGANLVATIPANMTLMVTCIGTTLTTAADWEWGFTDFGSVTGTGSVVLGTGPTITGGALNGTVGATTPDTGAFTTVTATTSIKSTGAGGIGYATGAGVAVTQTVSRTTAAPTTGNKTSGSITLFSAAGVAGWTSFTVPNTAIAITDTVILTVRGNTNTYVAAASTIIAGTSFVISFNAVAGVAVDAPTINFNIIRGVNA
jgi:hypothetical protein